MKAAIVIAAAYALCVLTPSVALAFIDGPVALHCLTDQHGLTAAHDHSAPDHVHADGTTHRHAEGGAPHEHSGTDGKSHTGNCCGLFCMSALAQESGLILAAPTFATPTQPSPETGLTGRGPDRIIRPPIA
jgi:hypothetical protein